MYFDVLNFVFFVCFDVLLKFDFHSGERATTFFVFLFLFSVVSYICYTLCIVLTLIEYVTVISVIQCVVLTLTESETVIIDSFIIFNATEEESACFCQ